MCNLGEYFFHPSENIWFYHDFASLELQQCMCFAASIGQMGHAGNATLATNRQMFFHFSQFYDYTA
jgi:hypothetical protein